MPGVPFLYYGNEIGMRQLGDLPYVEGAYKPRSGARTPMQWAPGKNLGFSSAAPEKLYLPVDAAADAPTVAAQENDPTSLLNRVRRLIRLKHTEPALAAYAEFVPLYAKSFTYPLVYARTNGDAVVLAIFNPSAQAASAELASPAAYKTLRLLAGKTIPIVKKAGTLRIDAPGQSYALYRLVK
jgi:maltose alpha-D-glucosyltransferase/alpha-amylase